MPINGTPLVEAIYLRLLKCQSFNEIILATTSRDCDTPLAEHFEQIGGLVYRGNREEVQNVTQRFISAGKSRDFKYAARINGDSPFPDPALIDEGWRLAHDTKADLVTNLEPRTFPYGIAVEWVRLDKLIELLPLIPNSKLEHVTFALYRNKEKVRIETLPQSQDPSPETQLTIDVASDLDRIKNLLGKTGSDVTDAQTSDLISAARSQL